MFDPKTFDWKPIAQNLNEALLQTSSMMIQANARPWIKDIQEFIDVGEYGLALEHLCGALQELKRPLPANVYTLLKEAGMTMRENGADLDPEVWEALRQQVTDEADKDS